MRGGEQEASNLGPEMVVVVQFALCRAQNDQLL